MVAEIKITKPVLCLAGVRSCRSLLSSGNLASCLFSTCTWASLAALATNESMSILLVFSLLELSPPGKNRRSYTRSQPLL